MKAKDLMIGDWVLQDDKPKKVDVIWGREVSLDDPEQEWGSIYTDKYHEREIQPIPLTWEFMENNFPEKPQEGEVAVGWWAEGDGFEVELPYDSKYQMSFVFYYVHEIQHALRLVGIDKEIKL